MALLEGFESTPLVSTLTWTKTYQDGSTGTSTVTRTTTHPTQGTYDWRIEGSTASGNYPGITNSVALDLSSYTAITLDVWCATLTDSQAVCHLVGAGGTPIHQPGTSDTTTTGSGVTLTFTIAGADAAGIDTSSCYIEIYAEAFTTGGTVDFYVDNLIGTSGGSSVPIFFNHLRTQGIA